MFLSEYLKNEKPSLSCELFPPKEGASLSNALLKKLPRCIPLISA